MGKQKVKKYSAKKLQKNPRGFMRFATIHLVTFSLGCFILGMFLGFGQLASRADFCANSISCIKDLSGNYKPNAVGEFMGQKVYAPPYIAENPLDQAVLGAATAGNRHIYIDLTNQKLMAFEGNALVYNFTVSTGWWFPTPTGEFTIWIKQRYANMQGGDKTKGDYYNLPNVPFTMYLYNTAHPEWEGYGIHDAYWLNSSDFGHPRSHGCINMQYADSQTLYNWASPTTTNLTTFATDSNPGTPVTIYGVTPNHYW